jgi:murein DD-endopeptidase MepM/ murein hydrolase activator NlpD
VQAPVSIVVIVLAGLTAACGAAADATGVPRGVDVSLARERTTVEARVPPHATLAGLLVANHLSADLASQVVTAVRGVFDPRTLRTDRPYRLTRGLDGSFRAFEYEIDADRHLSVAVRSTTEPGQPLLDVDVATTPHVVERRAIEADISREHPSLIGSLDAAGENVEFALRLADILGGEVDFNSELQRGDRVSALFERVVHDGTPGEYGQIDVAILQNAGRRIVAIRFDGPDGQPAWYDEAGRSLKRQFLKSPLPFEPRITSGFSMNRVHPIYGDVRPHLGVDYGAPAGTSVVAVAAGVVESAGWAGDAGRMVVLRHTGGYETLYLHLSAFAPGLHAGQHVAQGTLVGRVGQTGAATAPHLDYRIRKNGTYVNPVAELARMPKGDPIGASALPAFDATRDRVLQELSTRVASRAAAAPGPTPSAQKKGHD